MHSFTGCDTLSAFVGPLDRLRSLNTRQINELRYNMFLAKQGEAEVSLLPPRENSLLERVMRTCHQAGVR